jgi:hypothetical protein
MPGVNQTRPLAGEAAAPGCEAGMPTQLRQVNRRVAAVWSDLVRSLPAQGLPPRELLVLRTALTSPVGRGAQWLSRRLNSVWNWEGMCAIVY